MKKVMEFKGTNGIMTVYDECIAISRKTFGSFISQGGSSGDRKYFYQDISSIEYKKPTILADGFFKIISTETVETDAKVNLLSSSGDNKTDQNTVVLRAFSKEIGTETDKIYKFIISKISAAKK